jgi:hypothetical protein
LVRSILEVAQDRTFRAFIAVARIGEFLDGIPH